MIIMLKELRAEIILSLLWLLLRFGHLRFQELVSMICVLEFQPQCFLFFLRVLELQEQNETTTSRSISDSITKFSRSMTLSLSSMHCFSDPSYFDLISISFVCKSSLSRVLSSCSWFIFFVSSSCFCNDAIFRAASLFISLKSRMTDSLFCSTFRLSFISCYTPQIKNIWLWSQWVLLLCTNRFCSSSSSWNSFLVITMFS